MRQLFLQLIMLCCVCTITAQTQRRVLLEVFSTERCNNCPQAHKNIERIFGNGGDSIIMLGHHAGFYTDDFTIPESVDYEWFYTPDRGTYAPAAMIDRTCFSDAEPTVFQDGVPLFNGAKASHLQAAYEMAANVPAYAKVEAVVGYQNENRLLTATVTGQLLRQLPTISDVRLNVYLAEDSVFTQTQSGSMGSYYHRHMARHCFTGSWGIPVSMDDSFSQNYSLTLPTEWNADRVTLIAFLSNYNPDDRNNCQVLNATTADIPSASIGSITDVTCDSTLNTAILSITGQQLIGSLKGLFVANGRVVFIK